MWVRVCGCDMPVHSWEAPAVVRPLHAWEDAETPDECQSSDSEVEEDGVMLTGTRAAAVFCDYLMELHHKGHLKAKSVCVLSWWASRAGAHGRPDELAFKPTAQSGKFQQHLDRVMGTNPREEGKFRYRIDMPQHSHHYGMRESIPTPVNPPHEEVHKEVSADPAILTRLGDHVAGTEWADNYWRHPVVRRSARPVLPLALYLDGTPFEKRDTVTGIFIYNLVTHRRHLLATLRDSCLCRCGCQGHWCSLFCVWEMIAWSLTALAAGVWPGSRHDGGPWRKHDFERESSANQPLATVAAVVQIRGDWSEFAKSIGLPTWQSRDYPCYLCKATRADMYSCAGFSPVSFPWVETTVGDYHDACDAAERVVDLTREDWEAIKPLLVWDKRKNGSRGRALCNDYARLGLLKNDRLEPSSYLRDVARFEFLSIFPCRVVFWRKAAETRTKHRNPLFCDETGVTPRLLCTDKLHNLYLGVALTYVTAIFWRVVACDGYEIGIGRSEEEILEMTVPRIWNDLSDYYSRYRRFAGAGWTEMQRLTVKMMGTKKYPLLRTKAVETKCLVPFAIELVTKHRARIGEPQATALIRAGHALQNYFDLLHQHPAVVPPPGIQAMHEQALLFRRMADAGGIDPKPKFHQSMHMVHDTITLGNPKTYATFLDESLNKTLAEICAASHRAVWELRVYAYFDVVESQASKKRRLA